GQGAAENLGEDIVGIVGHRFLRDSDGTLLGTFELRRKPAFAGMAQGQQCRRRHAGIAYQSTWQIAPSAPNCMLFSVYWKISSFTPLGSAIQACQVPSAPSFLSVMATSWARTWAMKPSRSSVLRQIWLIWSVSPKRDSPFLKTSMKVRPPKSR